MAKKISTKNQLNSRVAINRIKVESQPSITFSGRSTIIPYGLDNRYPFRITQAIKKSPTASGCIKKQSEFIFGQGIKEGGDIVVNREGETLNEVINQSIRFGYSTLGGFALHFNFNLLGEICEIFFVNQEYIRKHRDLRHVDFGIWENEQVSFFTDDFITLDLYGGKNAIRLVPEGGFEEYPGQVFYYSKFAEIYPTSPLDSAVISASYEKEAQIYPYANIRNGFSGNTIIKLPTMKQGESAQPEVDKLQEDIQAMHGAEHAGSSVVTAMQMGVSGETKPFTMVEHLSPTNIDGLFVNQNKKAENDILKVYNMPGELIGIPQQGAFSRAAYDDAFNMKNSDVEIDRQEVERQFNKFLPNSCFGIDEIELVPMVDRSQESEPPTQ